MKLTLSSGGGVTGLTKEHSVDINSLDEHTRSGLLDYLNAATKKQPSNVNESWTLDDKQETPIDPSEMNEQVLNLYKGMKANLSYVKR